MPLLRKRGPGRIRSNPAKNSVRPELGQTESFVGWESPKRERYMRFFGGRELLLAAAGDNTENKNRSDRKQENGSGFHRIGLLQFT